MTPIDFDTDQALIKAYNRPLMIKKAVQEMQGIAAAVIYDGRVDDGEINLIREWFSRHAEATEEWPLSDLAAILNRVLADGVVTDLERVDLLNCLSRFAAGPQQPEVVQGIFDVDVPITFREQTFLFTGKLVFGTRKKAETAVVERGGYVAPSSVTATLNFLVVGELGSEAWKFSRFGAKIERAMKLREDGSAVPLIVQEKQFVQAVIGPSALKDRPEAH